MSIFLHCYIYYTLYIQRTIALCINTTLMSHLIYSDSNGLHVQRLVTLKLQRRGRIESIREGCVNFYSIWRSSKIERFDRQIRCSISTGENLFPRSRKGRPQIL